MAAVKLDRAEFIDFWVRYIRAHSDAEWSQQQNVLINSVLQTVQQISPQRYLELKGEKHFRG